MRMQSGQAHAPVTITLTPRMPVYLQPPSDECYSIQSPIPFCILLQHPRSNIASMITLR